MKEFCDAKEMFKTFNGVVESRKTLTECLQNIHWIHSLKSIIFHHHAKTHTVAIGNLANDPFAWGKRIMLRILFTVCFQRWD